MMENLQSILKHIGNEIIRQDTKWGANRNHTPLEWNAILTEEVGEFAEAALKDWNISFQTTTKENKNEHIFNCNLNEEKMYKEIIHVATVAIQIADSITRGKWHYDKISLPDNDL